MKKLLLMAILPISVALNAQSSGSKLLCDSIVTYSSAGYKVNSQVYTYDNNLNQICYAQYVWDSNGVCTPATKTEYTYDDKNRQLSETCSSYVDIPEWVVGWLYTSKKEKTYNDLGQETSYTEYGASNNVLYGSSKYDSEYDNNGFLVKRSYYSWLDNAWIHIGYVLYTNDENGNQLSMSSYSDGSQQSDPYQKTEFVYDANGNVISSITYISGVPSKKNTTEYDDNTKQTISCTYDYVGEKWAMSYKTISLNDRVNGMAGIEWYSVYNDELVGQNKLLYTFNEDETQITTSQYSWENGDWALSSKTYEETTYDADRNPLTSSNYYFNSNGEKVLDQTTTWYYSKHTATGIDAVRKASSSSASTRKAIVNGKLMIITPDGKRYGVNGGMIK